MVLFNEWEEQLEKPCSSVQKQVWRVRELSMEEG